jgi:hypothetical protein
MSRLSPIDGNGRRSSISLLSTIATHVFVACQQADPTAPVITKAPNPEAVKAVVPCSRTVQKSRDAALVATGQRIQAADRTAKTLAKFRCGLRAQFATDPKGGVPTRK